MRKQVIRSIGIISKKENLMPVEQLSGCKVMLLESADPFPGYHGIVIPAKNEPESMFIVLKQAYNDDKIIRAIMNIKKVFPYAFEGAPGTITMSNKTVHVIRLKNLSYMHIPELLESFRPYEIDFMKKKKISRFNALIKIRKFFEMKNVAEGIYQDMNQKTLFYLQVPSSLRWNTFERITMEIKYNIPDNKFDAAIGYVYETEGIFDFVRIFDKNFLSEKLSSIREKYLENISKL